MRSAGRPMTMPTTKQIATAMSTDGSIGRPKPIWFFSGSGWVMRIAVA